MKLYKKLLAGLLACTMTCSMAANVYAVTVSQKPSDGTTKSEPFDKGTGGSTSFRIPSLVSLSDGTLVAAADARWNTTYDGGGLDTIVSRSEDNGDTWNYTFANYLGDNGNVYSGSSSCYIDPAMAVTEDDTIYMLVDLYPYGVALNGAKEITPATRKGFDDNGRLILSNNNHSSYGYYLSDGKIYSSAGAEQTGYTVDAHFNITGTDGTNTNLFFADSPFKPVRTGFLYLTTSTDKGKSWSAPTLLDLKTSSEMVCLVAPGRGLVTANGTIVFPVYSYNGSEGSQRVSFLYSEDGKNWNRSSNFNYSWASESVAVELEDSTLRFFFRNGTTNLCYVDYDFAKHTWGTMVNTGISTNSNCQISAITYSEKVDGKQVILVSCPTGPNEAGSNLSGASYRLNGKIFVGLVNDDKTISWQKDRTMRVDSTHRTDTNFFMYSCMAEMEDGKIAILYEDNENGWGTGANYYYEMSYKEFALDLTGSFVTPEPTVVPTWEVIPVEKLTATAGNEEALSGSNQTEGPARFVLDDNTTTLWHTNWAGWSNRADHWIQFEINGDYEVCGLKYHPRGDAGSNTAYGAVTKYEIKVSNDGSSWETVATGNWPNSAGWKTVEFDAKEVKYVRLMSVESISDNRVFSSAAEIRLLGNAAAPEVTEEPTPEVTVAPTEEVTPEPTEEPTVEPTEEPTTEPTETPDTTEDVTKVFSDVHKDWYTTYVQYVYDNGLMTGIKGTTEFQPNANITKAQVAQVLFNMEEQPEVENPTVFDELNDVYTYEWYAKAVAWAYDTGVVTGDLKTKMFNPNADVTREQLALMMFRYAQYKEYDTSATSDFAGLTNADKVADWSMAGMKWAVGQGLISGLDKGSVKDLAPQGNATRAQMAAILQRFCE